MELNLNILISVKLKEMNKEEFLASGGLDFTVSKRKMLYEGIYDRKHDTQFFCTVNDKTGFALGPVKSRYTVLQNTDLLDDIIAKLQPGTYDLSESKCGMFQGGKKIYFFIKITNLGITIEEDAADIYLYALSSHDGSQRLVYGISTRMHSCSNMFGVLMSDKDNNHVVKHTKRISENSNTFINEMIDRNVKGLTRLFNKMKEHTVDENFYDNLMNIVVKSKGKDGRKLPDKSIKMRQELNESIDDEIANKGETYYGAFNGLTHFLTHKYHRYTNQSPEYEMLTGKFNSYIKKSLSMIVKDMQNRGINLN